jgi:hypothetical protein
MHSMTAAAEGLSLCLPGRIAIERGTREDYAALAHLHYAPGHPATWAGVWRAVWRDFGMRILDFGLKQAGDGEGDRSLSNPKSAIQNPKLRTIAVGVLSYPTPAHRTRSGSWASGPRYGEKLRFINEHVRTISRVIVHPQFRGSGSLRNWFGGSARIVLHATSKPSRPWGRCIRYSRKEACGRSRAKWGEGRIFCLIGKEFCHASEFDH